MTTTNHQLTSDLLEHLEVVVACNQCDTTYSVPASLVRESQRVLANGCSGSSLFECDASFYATLVEPEALDALEQAWARFQRSATTHGGIEIVVAASASQTPRVDADARGLERWENEGGRSG